ncbi:TonB family protein [Ferrimonas gelatinilytica]|uniref:Protein TonB n=1 Tax=Ferrimonas gelatinilytica TaxID=1255257 RepID=A0ABP9S881_9GAMM
MKSQWILIPLLSATLLGSPLRAQEPGSDALMQHYHAYQSALAAGDPAEAEQQVAQAYRIALETLGPEHDNTINLAFNWGNSLLALERKDEAHSAFEAALTSLEAVDGNEALTLLDPLVGQARASEDDKEAITLLERAIEIADEQGTSLQRAAAQVAGFDRLSHSLSGQRKAWRWMDQALETYRAELPENALERVKAEFKMGQIEMARGRKKTAIQHFGTVVEAFSDLSFDYPYELAAHARLVELYEAVGKRDLATPHCQAIGNMVPWSDAQEQTPLVRIAPDYPIAAARRRLEGHVVVEFTIDEQGFVQDPEVKESEGHKAFAKETLKALKQWRYAPKFDQGKPVPARTSVEMKFALE